MTFDKTTLLLFSLLFALSCSRSAGQDAETDDDSAAGAEEVTPEKEAVLIRASRLTLGTVEKVLESTANVMSMDVVELMPERAEPVIEVLVEEGDLVEAGQVLARLRDENAILAVAEADVRMMETQQAMNQAQRELERDKKLMESGGATGVLSDRDLETRRQTWDASKTAHQTAAVARDKALLDLAQCELISPISGTISVRDISLGDMATVGQRAFEITDQSRPKVVLYRPQRELNDLKVGQRLVATSDAFPGLSVGGYIERIAPTVDLATGTVKVTAALEPKGLIIPIGILAKLALVLDTHEDVLLIPKKALVHEGSLVYCYVVRDGKAVRVDVVEGFQNEDKVEAAAGTDLTIDDLVVVVGSDRISDGDPVEIADE
ncbi:MAG: efflux RND transporter periplasmic adaptor subunit [Planctomycetota bacterium]|nr:efflux RND transporter periplasmic adaptor subunit [Planctomycetota bacterium]MDA1112741.1 efflux RND transporter periplasmic adaptor subunit [Planctomycetota bacterium]